MHFENRINPREENDAEIARRYIYNHINIFRKTERDSFCKCSHYNMRSKVHYTISHIMETILLIFVIVLLAYEVALQKKYLLFYHD